jgi:hypothetical protein
MISSIFWPDQDAAFLLRPFLLLLLLMIPLVTFSQEGRDEPYRACIFVLADLSTDLSIEEDSERYQQLITEILDVEFVSAGFEIIPREKWQSFVDSGDIEEQRLLHGPIAMRLGRRLEADIAVTGFYYVEDEKIHFETKVYDIKRGTAIAGFLRSGRINISLLNLINRAVSELVPEVVDRLQAQVAGLQELEKVSNVTVQEITVLSEQEGMEIYLGEGKYLATIEDGKAVLPFIPVKVGTELPIVKQKEGYYSEIQNMTLDKLEPEIELSPIKIQSRYGLEFGWDPTRFLGLDVGFRYYLDPDWIFLRGDNHFWVQTNFRGSAPIFHDDIRATFGAYLFLGHESFFRIGIAAGIGCILTLVPGAANAPLFTDFYINISDFWLELNFGTFSLYAATSS